MRVQKSGMSALTLIKPQQVEVKWHPKNIGHYESYGYKRGKMGDIFFVDIEHLSLGSTFLVEIQCDYCEEKYEQKYKHYLKFVEKSPIKKDACSDCIGKKREESNMLVYGVKMPSALPEVREKIESTNIEIYGAPTPLQSKEWKKGFDERFLNKHGVQYPSQLPHVRKLSSKRMKIIMSKRFPKAKTLKINKSKYRGVYSKQQVYIHSVTGGEFNKTVGTYFLDIAFPDDKIFIEFDGGGHDLGVKLGKYSKEEFQQKEKERFNFLYYERGWREIRLVSYSDRLPDRENLLGIINEAYKELQETPYMMRKKKYLEKTGGLELRRIKGTKGEIQIG